MPKLKTLDFVLISVVILVSLPILGYLAYHAAVIGLSFWLGNAMCGETIYKTAQSPQKHYQANVVEFDCGATASWSTQVDLKNQQGWWDNKEKVFTVEGRPSETPVNLTWLNEHTLKITFPTDLTPYIQKPQWQGVTIIYKASKAPIPEAQK